MTSEEAIIRITCKHCDQENKSPAYKQGLWLRCKNCQRNIAIPIKSSFLKKYENTSLRRRVL